MKKLSIVIALLLIQYISTAQNNVGVGTSTPDPSALLELKSNNQGVLPPRMSYDAVLAIPNPAEGLLAYDSSGHVLRMFNGTQWVVLSQQKQSLSDAPGHFINLLTSGGTGQFYPEGMDRGSDNSLYITGGFMGMVTIGNQTITSAGSSDIFILKILPNGTLGWLRSIGSNASDEANNIAVDTDGSCIIVGHFENTVDFDPGAGIQNLVHSGQGDAFYAKYSSAGNWVWSKRVGGTGFDRAHSIDISGSFLYIGGFFAGTGATFNPTVLNSNGLDMFLCRYQTADGNLGASGWVRQVGGTGNDAITDLVVKGSVIYVGGYFSGTPNFGGATLTSAGGIDGFFARYTNTGVLMSTLGIGGLGLQYVLGIDTDAGGNIIIGGLLNESADFDPGVATFTLTSFSNTSSDGFVAKYSNLGAFIWAKSFGNAGDDFIKNVLALPNGDVLGIGDLSVTSVFNNSTLGSFTVNSSGSTDAILVGLSSDGLWQWAQPAGGSGTDAGTDIIAGSSSSVLVLSNLISTPSLNFGSEKVNSKGLNLGVYFP
jgi:hypothetical protein